jgi:hypothetical protein
VELHKFHQKAFADFCGSIINNHHGAIWQMADSLAFIGAFFGNLKGDFFARQKLVS